MSDAVDISLLQLATFGAIRQPVPTVDPLGTVGQDIYYDQAGHDALVERLKAPHLWALYSRAVNVGVDNVRRTPQTRWRYGSTNILGNAHDAVRVINEKHPEWDVIAMSMDGENGTPGSVTLVVYRTMETPTPDDPRRRTIGGGS